MKEIVEDAKAREQEIGEGLKEQEKGKVRRKDRLEMEILGRLLFLAFNSH